MVKRIFDILFSLSALLFLAFPLLVFWFLAALSTSSSGVFIQRRVGQFGKIFHIYKFRTITQLKDDRTQISTIGNFLRRNKLDELPQLFNVLKGEMSFVGPRPDIEGYYDKLQGEARKILELKPGLTNPASIKYFNEEQLLASVENPQQYNDEVVFPDKIKMNLEYYYQHSFIGDLKILFKTIFRDRNYE